MRTYVILHNIRSAHNVGSVFRTADGAGVAKLYLTGYTPGPIDRFGRPHAEIEKTSLGATKTVPYEAGREVNEVLDELTAAGVELVAVEQTAQALDYRTFRPSRDTAFIFGNEVDGIEESVLERASVHIEIPLEGRKESLNVSVCAAVILFTMRP
ncbi:MAG TPA: TrmH family RNA methyltransferase [Candidatus Paceibacterota bacterium]|nr:TrmH family RNA methyltransferase [Candidatus Paceibacterota bacterium]